MCMLCVVPPNVLPERDKLEASALNNPHGFGFAIVIPKERRILVEHTMDADKAINDFLARRAEYPEGYALWHARYATHGVKDLTNCHPFRVGNDKRTVLAHNGILPVLEDKKDHRSDTRIFAEDVLPKMGGITALDDLQMYNIIEDFTSGSKLCLLTVDPRAEYQCYIIHENKGWFDDNKVWWSNDTCFLQYSHWSREYDGSSWYDKYQYAKRKDAKGEFIDDEMECFNCKAVLDPDEVELITDGACMFCGACQQCFMTEEACMCYPSYTQPYSHGGSSWGKIDY